MWGMSCASAKKQREGKGGEEKVAEERGIGHQSKRENLELLKRNAFGQTRGTLMFAHGDLLPL